MTADAAMTDKVNVSLPAELRPDGRNRLMRLGSRYDGGYVIAAALIDHMDQLLSFGLGLNWDFERDVARLTAIRQIDCYDHTVTRARLGWIHAKSLISYFLNREKYAERIAACRDYPRFFGTDPRIRHLQMMVSDRDDPESTTVASALGRLKDAGDRIFLKCDIEGSEYAIADEIIASSGRFTGIAIEFHDVNRRLGEISAFLDQLRRTHFLDHVHVNSFSKVDSAGVPSVIEVSLSRRDLSPEGNVGKLDRLYIRHSLDGIELDASNAADRPDMQIVWS